MTASSGSPHVELRGLAKSFGGVRVLSDLSLQIGRGEIFALLGPSGSGKTTALRLLAGFEQPDAGRVFVGGEDVTAQPPVKRRFGMVFQHYALFPHLTVRENVGFGLTADQDEASRVREMLELVDLDGYGERPVTALSGGQQQRVALARALAPAPRVLLLDEPLSNLDPALRERTRRHLREAVESTGITTVLVTHEQEEAFDLGDRVAVLHEGGLEQVGRPEELYQRPATVFVADFVGRAVQLPGRRGSNGVEIGTEARRVTWAAESREPVSPGAAVLWIARPETLRLTPPEALEALTGKVIDRRYAGPLTYYSVELDLTEGPPVEVEVTAEPDAAKLGDSVGVAPRAQGPPAQIFPLERS